ncbi:MAG: hypothetical protein JW395_1616 [Nitrospira sp.]|nr:hypothetical protein [Nitrospira sp.]
MHQCLPAGIQRPGSFSIQIIDVGNMFQHADGNDVVVRPFHVMDISQFHRDQIVQMSPFNL